MPVPEPGAGAPGLDPNPAVRADRICIAGTGGAGCALLYNDAKSFCWGQAGTNVTDNCQLANGCGYIKCCEVPSAIQNLSGSPITINYKWTGSKAEFEALDTYRADTEYNVID